MATFLGNPMEGQKIIHSFTQITKLLFTGYNNNRWRTDITHSSYREQ